MVDLESIFYPHPQGHVKCVAGKGQFLYLKWTEMNALLEKIIPGHIGRYTDEFYPTATGDNFQKLGHNTILIEAGHYYNDYERDVVRKFNFYALLQGVLILQK